MVDRPAAPVADAQALRAELLRHAPFAQMSATGVDALVAAAKPMHFATGETLLEPEQGPVTALLIVRAGKVVGRLGCGADAAVAFQYESGDVFPVGALLGERAVSAHYRALDDVSCARIDAAVARGLAEREPAWADFLNRRVQHFLELSRRGMQAESASQLLAEQSLEAPLGTLERKPPLCCGPDTALADALQDMHQRRVGSVLVVDERQAVLGILTRYDVLGRVTLAGCSLDTPIREVMSAPVHTLDSAQTAQDAALLMSRHGVRHLPVTEAGRVVSIVSERDLFALQRLSMKHVGTRLRAAADVATLREAAPDIRRFARGLVAQGVGARVLTGLISHLNDVLTERLVEIVAQRHGIAMSSFCWLAFGSEGRSEQTISTDQDNGLVFVSEQPDPERAGWLAFGREVNEALDACGYPLCKGGIMAGQPACCLSLQEWLARFAHWIEHGAPQDLLNASIFFDLRALAGADALAAPLRALIGQRARGLPRFARQLAENAMRSRAPINWLGAIEAEREQGREGIDLKLHGTALFVDIARLYALVHGVPATGTRERLEAIAPLLKVPAGECASWVGAFEFLQTLRLRRQMTVGAGTDNPNRIELDTLSDIDRRMLKESLRIARRLQQRLALDWLG